MLADVDTTVDRDERSSATLISTRGCTEIIVPAV
jgi:hypothetical protein